jgi:Zn-dependent peptidase ImmA (M78 family)
MMYISKQDIENIGNSVLRDFTERGRRPSGAPIDIELLAQWYLGLNIRYVRLEESIGLLGLTTTKDLSLEILEKSGGVINLFTPKNTVLIDNSLLKRDNLGRRRFTIAHECAHQILSRIEGTEAGIAFRQNAPYPRELKSDEDWMEWQANALAAVLLMPQPSIFKSMAGFNALRTLTEYGSRFNTPDYTEIRRISERFEVSISALTIRLRELGFVKRKPESEYTDPLDILVG